MNTTTSTSRILGETQRGVRPPTEEELTDPRRAYYYAVDVIRGRWLEGEATIATSPHWAQYYAEDVIRGRFPEGEAAIATVPAPAYYYARDIIGGRFPEGEAAIAKDPPYAELYLKAFPVSKLEWAMNGGLDWLDL
jgi:hypothetical protein